MRLNPAARRPLNEILASLLIWTSALLVTASFVWLLADIVLQGLARLDWEFLSASPLDAGRQGGIAPLLVSTLWILGICLMVVIPFGLATALALTESLRPYARLRRLLLRSLDVLSGVPSIVFGLFGYAVFAKALGLGFSILSGGLTLACMALPIFVRVSAQALEMVPGRYRQASEALALSQWRWQLHILLPQASGGIAAALILSMGRALAETAVLIFTAGYVMRMPGSVFDSGRALAVHIYDLSMNVPGGNDSAAATALVLVALLVGLNLFTRRLLRDNQAQD